MGERRGEGMGGGVSVVKKVVVCIYLLDSSYPSLSVSLSDSNEKHINRRSEAAINTIRHNRVSQQLFKLNNGTDGNKYESRT